MEKKLTIEVDHERVLERCVQHVLGHGAVYYDEDGEYGGHGGFAAKMSKLVRERVETRVEELVDEIAREQIAALVQTQIEAVVAEGFPVFDRDGRDRGKEPFAAYVRKAIDGMFPTKRHYGRNERAVTMAENAFKVHVREAFKGETEVIKKRVRAYVDEQLAGAVVKSLREAVGLRS